MLIVEVKEWDEIDNYIVKYFNCKKDDIVDQDYRFYFIKQYFNLFNIINFDLTKYRGIDTLYSIKDFAASSSHESKEYQNMFISVMSNIKIIDDFVENELDIQNLFFIISIFEESHYMKERKYIVDFITCIEFLLVKKIKGDSSKIENQFKFKVKKCCGQYNYSVPINELKELYNYRSIIVHGNFSEINRKTYKITQKKWYRDFMNQLNDEYGIFDYDNNEREDLIYSRLYEIFNIVFKLYCDNKVEIESLKSVIDKKEIEQFEF